MPEKLNSLPIRLKPAWCSAHRYRCEVDALAAVLAAAGVRGTIAATLNAADPWGFDLDDIPGAAFHAITEGAAWLCLPGQPDTRLLPGDVVLLPTGTAHVLASDPGAGTVPFDRAAA